jgi:Sec-independent protein secretion pathway component TatC
MRLNESHRDQQVQVNSALTEVASTGVVYEFPLVTGVASWTETVTA